MGSVDCNRNFMQCLHVSIILHSIHCLLRHKGRRRDEAWVWCGSKIGIKETEEKRTWRSLIFSGSERKPFFFFFLECKIKVQLVREGYRGKLLEFRIAVGENLRDRGWTVLCGTLGSFQRIFFSFFSEINPFLMRRTHFPIVLPHVILNGVSGRPWLRSGRASSLVLRARGARCFHNILGQAVVLWSWPLDRGTFICKSAFLFHWTKNTTDTTLLGKNGTNRHWGLLE